MLTPVAYWAESFEASDLHQHKHYSSPFSSTVGAGMALVAKGYRVVPQSLAVDSRDNGGHGFRHLHLKEHRGVFKAMGSTAAGKDGRKVTFAKGQTLFVGNVDDQGVFWADFN